MLNVFQPSLGEEETNALRDLFATNWLGKGPKTAEFEAAFAAHIGVERALVQSVNSCTEGLFQAMHILGIGAGDEVILPTISFVGAANAVVACGATPRFCDVDARTLNPSAADIERLITPHTKAVIPLHYGGVPCDMDALCALLGAHNIALIEDCAISVASRYKDQACGTFGEIGVWSFDAMKSLVTGDGGMLYCHREEASERARKLLFLGLENKSGFATSATTRWWEYELSVPGRQAGMNDITSTIGLVQLQKLAGAIARRRAITEQYNAGLGDCAWLHLPPAIPAAVTSSYYFYWVQMESTLRDALAPYLRERGIYTTFRYFPLHRTRYYAGEHCLPCAEDAAETTLCLPLHQALTDDEVEQVITAVRRFGKDH